MNVQVHCLWLLVSWRFMWFGPFRGRSFYQFQRLVGKYANTFHSVQADGRQPYNEKKRKNNILLSSCYIYWGTFTCMDCIAYKEMLFLKLLFVVVLFPGESTMRGQFHIHHYDFK